MDLLFKRYASPLLYLDSCITMDTLFDGVVNLYKANDDEQLWELYLHSYPSKSFDEWKKEITTPTSMTQVDVQKEVEMAQNILKTFRL